LANWFKKEDLTICCLQGTCLIDRNKHWLRVKGWKIYQANDPPKQAGIAILKSDKVDFKLLLVKRDKEGHFILLKGAVHQKEITITNLYVPSVSALSFIKHTVKDLKTHVDSNTVVVGDFNIPLSFKDRSSKQKNTNPRTK
jgi:exonuclease III